ncbi:MAG: class I tRNA ligase family protein [Candidatus Paceibacterota bacterium]
MKEYDHKKIEKKWQKEWEKTGVYEAKNFSKKPKFYGLIEFPYPSGAGMHVGHIRSNTAMDIISRKRRMEGYNVLYPIGWDAFGLPTENYAIKTGIHPIKVTKDNTDTFRRQLKSIGFSFDWSREINTTDPKYYKWTQWIFLQLLKKGLAYKAKSYINWCLSCKIGLANEEVVNDKCERCGGDTEKREKEQWMLAITKYADRLDKDLDTVDYLSQIKLGQRNWIGRSEGAEIDFEIKNNNEKIKVFTTRPDTIFGATYVILAPDHELVQKLKSQIKNWSEVEKYIKEVKSKTDIERTTEDKIKTGVELKGIKVINPATQEEIPIWIADYVLASYGTGAIMAVPAHDERDFEFAKKFNLSIRKVIEPIEYAQTGVDAFRPELPTKDKEAIFAIVKHWKEDKYLCLKWKNAPWNIFITGGIENNEKIIDSAIREVEEESGYFDIKKAEDIDHVMYAQFYHPNRKINLKTRFHTVYLELGSDARKEISQEEKDKHETLWIPREEVEEFINVPNGKHAWRIFQGLESRCFTQDGILVNSGKFNKLDSKEATKEIVKFIGGKEKTTFKLRDWVFSRQRYWGEPIPVVYCESCKNRKYNYILLHGYKRQDLFIPWLKMELEKQGHKVYAPLLPNPLKPNVVEQVEFILKNTVLTENTIIMGVSLGAVVAMKLAEKTKSVIAKLVLVDGFIKPEFTDQARPDVERSFDWKFNFKKIISKTKERIILADKDFSVVPEWQLQKMAEIMNADILYEKPIAPHFQNNGPEPEILNTIIETGWMPVSEKDLPVELPKVKNYQPTNSGESPLANISKWVNVKCPKCKGKGRRETDTMPNWAGSSWYFLRYVDSKNKKEFASKKNLKYWTPVDWYNGGMEHTTLHLLYSRFWHKFLFDLKLVPTSEPYQKRTSHGMILGEGGAKMSKSLGNVINPDDIVKTYGADTLRLYEMFMGPFSQSVAWSEEAIIGPRRFLERIWNLQSKVQKNKKYVEFEIEKAIKKVSSDIEEMKFNTAISTLMIFINEVGKLESISQIAYEKFLKILSPFAPHIVEELWQILGHQKSINLEPWPMPDLSKIKDEEIKIVVQVNGKVRTEIMIKIDDSEEDIKKQVISNEVVLKQLADREVKKVFYVKNRLINIVV